MYTHRIQIYTASLLITGDYELPTYRRVSDAINGEQRRFLPLRSATVARIGGPQSAYQVPELLCERSEALLVATVAEAPPPADYPLAEQRREMVALTAVLFTEAFVVRGTCYVRPRLSLAEELERSGEDFLRLRAVQVFPLAGGPPHTHDFAALARARIVALYQGAALTTPTVASAGEAVPAGA